MKKRIIFGLLIFAFLVVLGFVLFNFFSAREDNKQPEEQAEYIEDNKIKNKEENNNNNDEITDGYNSKDEYNPFKLHNEHDEYNENCDLYEMRYNDDWLYINEAGDVVLRFSVTEYNDVGEFADNRAFLGKKTKIFDNDNHDTKFDYKLTYLTIIDSDGNVIKSYEKPALVIDSDGETGANFMPEFYKGYAKINFVTNGYNEIERYSQAKVQETYVNLNGEIVKKSEINSDILKILDNNLFPMVRYRADFNFIPKATKCSDEFSQWDECFAYFDKESNVILQPKYNSAFVYCGDWYSENPMFYNNRAKAFYRAPSEGSYTIEGYYYFIDKEGKPINESRYQYAEPFYRKLTIVSDYETGEWAYINTDGKIVWSDQIQKERDKKRNKRLFNIKRRRR